MRDEEREADQPTAPNPCPEHVEGMRSFPLKSPEAEAALCPPRDPWVWAGGLPREPRVWERAVIVERGRGRG